MSQLTFPWNDVNGISSSGATIATTSNVVEVVPRIVPSDTRSAERCRMAAAAMEKHIKAKHDSANRTLALPPTRKRLQDADAQRRQAILLERVQRTLQRLAEMHELGTITPELAPLTSKGPGHRPRLTGTPAISTQWRTAAIISEGAFHRADKKASAFRQFLTSTNAVDAKLPSASFKPSGTAVACRMIRIKAGC